MTFFLYSLELVLIGIWLGLTYNEKTEESKMANINDYAVSLTKREGQKKSQDIAQVKELLALINKDLGGLLYPLIRVLWKKK